MGDGKVPDEGGRAGARQIALLATVVFLALGFLGGAILATMTFPFMGYRPGLIRDVLLPLPITAFAIAMLVRPGRHLGAFWILPLWLLVGGSVRILDLIFSFAAAWAGSPFAIRPGLAESVVPLTVGLISIVLGGFLLALRPTAAELYPPEAQADGEPAAAGPSSAPR